MSALTAARDELGVAAVAAFVDLRPLFRDHGDYLGRDGIVFSQAGARAAALTLWGVLDSRCVPR